MRDRILWTKCFQLERMFPVYVRYKEIQGPDGSVARVRSVSGDPNVEIPPVGEDFPPDVKVLDYDSRGLDPYEYLNLQ